MNGIRETEQYPYESRNPYESPESDSRVAAQPAGLIIPAVLCLLFCLLSMGAGRVFWWALKFRMSYEFGPSGAVVAEIRNLPD